MVLSITAYVARKVTRRTMSGHIQLDTALKITTPPEAWNGPHHCAKSRSPANNFAGG